MPPSTRTLVLVGHWLRVRRDGVSLRSLLRLHTDARVRDHSRRAPNLDVDGRSWSVGCSCDRPSRPRRGSPAYGVLEDGFPCSPAGRVGEYGLGCVSGGKARSGQSPPILVGFNLPVSARIVGVVEIRKIRCIASWHVRLLLSISD